MTANEMSYAIGHTVQYRAGSMRVDCKVVDVKLSYGKVRLLIEPAAGNGQQWVETSSVSLSDTVKALVSW